MNIKRVSDIDEVLQCIPYEQEIRNRGRDISSISTMLLGIREMLENPLFGFWIAYDKDEIIGYMSAIASTLKTMKRLILLRIYAPKKNVQTEFKKVLIDFGKEFKIKPGIVRIEMFKNDGAMQRKGWKKVSTIMEKRYY